MRVLSYNIHKGIGGRDRLYRLQRVVDVIEHENPDFLCLQEVDRNVRRSHFDDQPQMLSEYFNLPHRMYRMNVHLKQGGYGNLLLSRWPFVAQHEISLRKGNRKPRSAQIAIVESPEGAFKLVNFHLGLAETERQWQVQHLLSHRLYREYESIPTLIVGDTNDWRNLLGRGLFEPAGLNELTSPPSRYRSFPAYLAVGALDKAFCCANIEIRETRIARTVLTRKASDHLPLIIDFHLRSGHNS